MVFQQAVKYRVYSSRPTVGIPPSFPYKGEAVLVTNNQRVHDRAKDVHLYQLQGENGNIPLHVSYDPISGDNSLVLVDLGSSPKGSEGLLAKLEDMPKEHHTVIGVHPLYIAYFPGSKGLNGYSGIDYQPIQKILREANRPNP
mgnify:CR=1 FL=1